MKFGLQICLFVLSSVHQVSSPYISYYPVHLPYHNIRSLTSFFVCLELSSLLKNEILIRIRRQYGLDVTLFDTVCWEIDNLSKKTVHTVFLLHNLFTPVYEEMLPQHVHTLTGGTFVFKVSIYRTINNSDVPTSLCTEPLKTSHPSYLRKLFLVNL